METGLAPVPKDHARGVYLDSGNVLVMINGERVNESSFGKASVYMPYIPIEVIEKIEFIRGPGSAIYGSNAFLGVMNIVTSKERNAMQLVVGNNGRYGSTGQFNRSVNDDTSLYMRHFLMIKKTVKAIRKGLKILLKQFISKRVSITKSSN